MRETMGSLEIIQSARKDIAHQEEALKEFQIDFEKRLKKLPSYREYQEAKDTLKQKRKLLNTDISQNGSIVAAQESMSKIRSDIKTLKDVLNMHLVRYYEDKDGHLPAEKNQSQEIILKARLGKLITLEKRSGSNTI
jgi:protein subunit release factor A